jgi:hypothetical protein
VGKGGWIKCEVNRQTEIRPRLRDSQVRMKNSWIKTGANQIMLVDSILEIPEYSPQTDSLITPPSSTQPNAQRPNSPLSRIPLSPSSSPLSPKSPIDPTLQPLPQPSLLTGSSSGLYANFENFLIFAPQKKNRYGIPQHANDMNASRLPAHS